MYLLGIDVSLCGGNSFITGFRGDTKKWIGNTEQNKNTQRKSCSLKNCTALWMLGISLGQREDDDISTFVSLGYDVVVVQFGGYLQNTLIWKTRALFSALSLSYSCSCSQCLFSSVLCWKHSRHLVGGHTNSHTAGKLSTLCVAAMRKKLFSNIRTKQLIRRDCDSVVPLPLMPSSTRNICKRFVCQTGLFVCEFWHVYSLLSGLCQFSPVEFITNGRTVRRNN